ncbi:hypothetical protein [Rhodospirillum sp. A1_3_36]|uniref:hypothetical protein n=1 Tax=Rhodospirillum sp. A1_3_36 TaxID=3391666 RepID=UPI0039A67B3B
MTDDPVNLDGRRDPAGQIATDIRRHTLKAFEADQEALRLRQEELEQQLMADRAETWTEAALKAEYLIRQYAKTAEGQDARRTKLINGALGDLARLIERDNTKVR